MDGYLCFNIYKGWMKSKSQVCGSSKEVSAKRKRDKDEVEDVDEDSSKVAVSLLMVVLMQCLPDELLSLISGVLSFI